MVTFSTVKLLIIYAGGTIGMSHHPDLGYFPKPNFLSSLLSSIPTFCDPSIENVEMMVTPVSMFGKRVAYKILEYDPLLDSSNMTMADWVKIATDIERNYHNFDAFLILHGTDTMSYTASALSFMLENLGKTVVITGSQIPLSELRNDAQENLLGAMTIASHYVIPEVGLYFNHRLFRGNRTIKFNALSFDAFQSPCMRPLVNVGVNVEVDWNAVWKCSEIKPFTAHKEMNPNVGTLRLFPGITEATVRAFLAPGLLDGVVLETFGAGNAPNNRPDLLKVFSEAVERGVVIVNCSQCRRGMVSDLYATGRALANIGIVQGLDMTAECALTKLSYLLSFPNLSRDQVRAMMQENLRGELSTPLCNNPRLQSQSPHNKKSLLGQIYEKSINCWNSSERRGVERTIRPLFISKAVVEGNLQALEDLYSPDEPIDLADYNGESPLELAVRHGKVEAAEWLIRHGASVHRRDLHGNSMLRKAIDCYEKDCLVERKQIIDLLLATGATN